MTGLLLKDIYTLRSFFLRQFTLMLVVYFFVALGSRNMMLLPPMLILSAIMMLISSFSVDESAHWNTYALTLPVNTRNIVAAKYILFLGSMLLVACLSLVLAVPVGVFVFQQDAVEIIGGALTICVLYIPVCCILLPIFIKLGVEKARLYMMLAFLVPFFLVMFGGKYLEPLLGGFANPTLTQIVLWAAIAVLACAILVFISYQISVKLFESKEF